MATTTKKKTTAPKTAPKSTPKTDTKVESAPKEQEKADELKLTDVTPGTPKIGDDALIRVKSNVFGELVYVNKRNGEVTKWANNGDIQTLEMGALRAMRANSIAFFANQWIIPIGFDDENADKYKVGDIFKALYITQYYKDFIDPADYVTICSWTPAQIKEKVPLMSDGAKANLAVALNDYIEKGVLDSLRAIKTFEEVLMCDLKNPE